MRTALKVALLGTTGVQADLNRIPQVLSVPGRMGVMAIAVNRTAANTFGASNALTTIGRRVGGTWYVLLAEQSTPNVWIGYDIPKSIATPTANGPNHQNTQAIYKPMKLVRFDSATVRNQSSAAIGLPYTDTDPATKNFTWDVGATEPNATRLGVVVGLGASNCEVLIVSIKNSLNATVTPNLLPTAAQMVTRGQITASAVVSGGGAIPDAAYCMGTNGQDNGRCDSLNYNHVPLADNLPPDAYKITFTPTGVPGQGGGTATRCYWLYGAYGTPSMSHTDSGAQLFRMGYWMHWGDASANDTQVPEMRVNGTANAFLFCGCGHGNDTMQTKSLVVDGVTIPMDGTTTTRQRTSNVAKLKIPSHGLQAGTYTVSGLGGTGYNTEGAVFTIVDSDYISYPDTGADEGETADTGGLVIREDVILFTTSSTFSRTGYLTHTNYGSGTTPVVNVDFMSYTLDRQGLLTNSQLSVLVDIDNRSGYQILASPDGGGYATYGPEFLDYRWIRPVGTQHAEQLKANDDSQHFLGQYLGYIFWDSTFGRATAIVPQFATFSPQPWNQNRARTKIIDRAASGPSTDKFYLSYNEQLTVTYPAGTILRGTYRRYDRQFPSGYSDSLLKTS